MKRALTLPLRLPLLASSALVGLHLLPGAKAVLLAAACVAAAGLRLGLARMLVAVALLGLPFLSAAASLIGLTPTTLVMGLDVMLLLAVAAASPTLLSRRAFKGVRYFLVWWLVFLVGYSASAFGGEFSGYSLFAWQYLAVYGSYYALAGVLAVRYATSLPEILCAGLPLFAFHYWLLDASIVSISQVADAVVGLRADLAFDPISGARTAGLLLLMALAVFVVETRRLRWLPEIALAAVLAIPLTWYAYTRQVYVALILVALAMFVSVAFGRRAAGEKVSSRLVLVATLCIAGLVATLHVLQLLASDVQSRIVQQGLESDRMVAWKASIEIIADHFVTGIGVGGFQLTGIGAWPHNWIIEAWLALGLPGLALTLTAAAVVVLAVFRRGETWLKGWTFLGLYYLLVAQVSADIARNAPIFFFIALGFHAAAHFSGAARVPREHGPAARLGTASPEAEGRGW